MLLNRVIKTATKADALLTIYFLITVAMMIGGSLAYNLAEGSILGSIITTLIGWVLCWDMVNAVVESAIMNETDKRVRQEIQNHRENLTSDGITEKQYREFLALVPLSHRSNEASYQLSLYDTDLEEIRDKILIREATVRGLDILSREAIFRGLSNEDDPLRGIALSGALHAIGKDNANQQEIVEDTELKVLWHDIYVYLKTWLMLSIKNEREMDFKNIKKRYPTPETPNKNYYIKAFKYIKNHSLRSENLKDYIDSGFVNSSIKILDRYLAILIKRLQDE